MKKLATIISILVATATFSVAEASVSSFSMAEANNVINYLNANPEILIYDALYPDHVTYVYTTDVWKESSGLFSYEVWIYGYNIGTNEVISTPVDLDYVWVNNGGYPVSVARLLGFRTSVVDLTFAWGVPVYRPWVRAPHPVHYSRTYYYPHMRHNNHHAHRPHHVAPAPGPHHNAAPAPSHNNHHSPAPSPIGSARHNGGTPNHKAATRAHNNDNGHNNSPSHNGNSHGNIGQGGGNSLSASHSGGTRSHSSASVSHSRSHSSNAGTRGHSGNGGNHNGGGHHGNSRR